MRRRNKFITVTLFAFYALFASSALFSHHVPGEVLIKWKTPPTANLSQLDFGLVALNKVSDIGGAWTLWKITPEHKLKEALDFLSANPEVETAQPNHLRRPLGRIPNDPLVGNQKHLDLIRAYAAWDFDVAETTSATVVVIDTGVDLTHPDLADNIWTSPLDSSVNGADEDNSGFDGDAKGRNFASSNNDASDIAGHGTLVAGVAAARGDNAIGVAGVSWRAKILPLQIFKLTGCGLQAPPCADDATLAQAINYAVRVTTTALLASYTGRAVINLSLGGDTTSQILLDAVNLALRNNIPVVAAKGNEATANPVYPSDYPGVIGVGATANNDTLAWFSNFGAGADIMAPGVDVFGAKMGGGYADNDGTSFSSPQVAGAVTLIYSILPQATTSQIETVLFSAADDLGEAGRDNSFGYGRLNLLKLMRRAKFGTLADFDGLTKAIAIPNPFKPEGGRTATFSVPNETVSSNAEVKIYDLSGTLVRELTGFSWDGKNAQGFAVASGVYIFHVATDKGKSQGRIIVNAG